MEVLYCQLITCEKCGRCKCTVCGQTCRAPDCSRTIKMCGANGREFFEVVFPQMVAEIQAKGRSVSLSRKEPGLARQAWSYAKAIAKWTAAGSPVRPQEEIDRIMSICEACPHFSNTKRPHCKLCGCSLNKSPDGLVNKIAMQTEECPIEKW